MAKKSVKSMIRSALARSKTRIKPIVIRAAPVVKHHAKRAVHHVRGGIRGFLNPKKTALMIGAFAVGVLEKQGFMTSLPALPFIGRTGTIGLAAHFIAGGRPGIAEDISTAALVIAAHELGSTGSIIGGDGGWESAGGAEYVDAY